MAYLKKSIQLISPDPSFSKLTEKAVDYLNAGVDRVWLIDSKVKKITIFSPDSLPQTKSNNDSLADKLFPNLQLNSQKIFTKAGLL